MKDRLTYNKTSELLSVIKSVTAAAILGCVLHYSEQAPTQAQAIDTAVSPSIILTVPEEERTPSVPLLTQTAQPSITVLPASTVQVAEADIVGGKDAPAGSADDMVSLRNSAGEHFCSGVVIGPRHVVTNYHCQYVKGITAYSGSENLSDMTERGTAVAVYTLMGYGVGHGDVAVLEFDADLGLQTARLPAIPAGEISIQYPVGQQMTLYGHGPTALLSEDISRQLQELELNITDRLVCNYVSPRHMCIGGNIRQSATPGDSGGKVVLPTGVVAGLISAIDSSFTIQAVKLGTRPVQNWIRNVLDGTEQPVKNNLQDGSFFFQNSGEYTLATTAASGFLSDNEGMGQEVRTYNPDLFIVHNGEYLSVAQNVLTVRTDGSFSFEVPRNLPPDTYYTFVNECVVVHGQEECIVTTNKFKPVVSYIPAILGETQ